jgi:hypothetical protein
MKTFFLPIAAAALLVAGCSDGSKAKPADNSSSVLTAPVDYIGAATKAQKHAVKTVDLAAINQAIQMFQVDESRFPKDLNELVEQKYLPQLPAPPPGSKLAYDPATGKVSVVPK